MLVQDVEILDNLNIVKRKSKKTQILLYDTQRRIDDFINKIRYRKNGGYDNEKDINGEILINASPIGMGNSYNECLISEETICKFK